MRVLDVHNHLGRDLAEGLSQTADALLARMDEAGIERAVVFAFEGGPDVAGDNERVLEAAVRFPDRLIPFWVLIPTVPQDEREQIPNRLRALATGTPGIKGIVLNPTMHTFRLAHPLIVRIAETCAELGMPVMVHLTGQWVDEPGPVRALATAAPGATFVVPAPFWTPGAITVLKDLPNVFFDTSKSYGGLTFRSLMHEVGAERVLFGSETPKMDPSLELAKIREFEFTDEQRDAILFGTAARLLNLSLA